MEVTSDSNETDITMKHESDIKTEKDIPISEPENNLTNNTCDKMDSSVTETCNDVLITTDTEVQVTQENSDNCEMSNNENDSVASTQKESLEEKKHEVSNENAKAALSEPQIIKTEILDDNNELVQKLKSNLSGNTAESRKIVSPVCEKPVNVQVREISKNISSLSAIALEYNDSDSETEDTESETQNDKTTTDAEVVNKENLTAYRVNQESSSSDDSESDSDSDDSSPDAENSDDSTESKDSDNTTRNKKTNKTREKQNELKSELDDLPPIEELKISVPEVLCEPLGEIAWMVNQLVVVRPTPGKPTLNLDTVLFVEKGQRPLGKIFDVFGQVSEPHYCVRFNSSEHIQESDIKVGMTVYFCPNTQYTSLVFLHELIKMKGTDAVGDDEPPEFSDDEEERAYYESLKQKQANANGNKPADNDSPQKRKRTSSPTSMWKSNHPWNRNAKQAHRKGHNMRKDRRQFSPNGYPQWQSFSYQNSSCWPPVPRHMHPAYNNQFGYPPYSNSPQQAPYYNSNNSEFSQDYPSTDNQTNPPHPNNPYGAPPRFFSGFPPFTPNQSNVYPNVQYPCMPWQSQSSSSSWSSLPPPQFPPPANKKK